MSPNTTCYYRAIGSNTENTVPQNGTIVSFATPGIPDIQIDLPSGIVNGSGTLAFAQTRPGETTSVALLIRNTGTGSLDFLSAGFAGNDAGLFQPTTSQPTTIPAGGQVSYPIRFQPVTHGNFAAQVTFASNDPDENPLILQLQGTGNNPPAFGGMTLATAY